MDFLTAGAVLREQLLRLIENLLNQVKQLVAKQNSPTPAGRKLHEVATSLLGSDVTPQDEVDDEFACAEVVNKIHETAFGEPIGGGPSTYWLYQTLKNHRSWVLVTNPLAGDIVLSPTGYGGRNGIKNGHVGICDEDGKIMSNNSFNGHWERNYDRWSWQYRYQAIGGYPVYYFRKVL